MPSVRAVPRPSSAPPRREKMGSVPGQAVSALTGILGDVGRKTEFLDKLDIGLRQGADLHSIKVSLQGEAQVNDRLASLRQLLNELARGEPKLQGVFSTIVRECERVITHQRRSHEVSEGPVSRKTLDGVQSELLHQIVARRKDGDLVSRLQNDCKELRKANIAHAKREQELLEHVNRLHDVLQRAFQRLFISGDPEDGAEFHGLRLGMDHPPHEFLTAARRLALEVEHLRAANHALGEARLDQHEQFTNLQAELNLARRRINELTASAATLRGKIESTEAELRSAQADRQQGLEDAAARRTLTQDLAVANTGAQVLGEEMVRFAQLSTRCNRTFTLPDLRKRQFWSSKGNSYEVPRHLRTKNTGTKIPCTKPLGAEEAFLLMREMWQDRRDESDPQNKSATLPEFLGTWAGGRTASEKERLELVYGLDDAWKQMRGGCAEVDLTMSILEGNLPETIQDWVSDTTRLLRQTASAPSPGEKRKQGGPNSFRRGSVASKAATSFRKPPAASSKVTTHSLERILTFLNSPPGPPFQGGDAGREYRKQRLRMSLAVATDPASQEVDVVGLLDQVPSPLVEALVRDVQQELASGYWTLSSAIFRMDRERAAEAEIEETLLAADPRIPQEELQRWLSRGRGIPEPGDKSGLIDLTKFLERIKRRCFLRVYDPRLREPPSSSKFDSPRGSPAGSPVGSPTRELVSPRGGSFRPKSKK
eukprot:Hpha_TRINITY_DN30326_c0_g1::TRINITY_DN30326_c0_g1_i1::g.147120::m.147120